MKKGVGALLLTYLLVTVEGKFALVVTFVAGVVVGGLGMALLQHAR